MTTPEAPRPQPEQELNPLQVARGAFTNSLFAENTQDLIGGINKLEVELVRNGEDPIRVYVELVTSARQAIERSKILEGQESPTASVLQGFEERYAIILENFHPQATTARVATQPTVTENLSPMTSAKGGESRTRTTAAPRRQAQTTTPASPEAQEEENFSSFLRQKRNEAGLSQIVLGKVLGGQRNNNLKISGLENGRRTVDLEGVRKILSELGINEETNPEEVQRAIELYNNQFPPDPQE